MCGIAGILNGLNLSRNNIEGMVNALCHRGPDAQGVWGDGGSGISLGHTRLSIVDLSSAGSQPMESASGRFIIVFNGEIYNHLLLRQEIESVGASLTWRGHSDTETILACIEIWGVQQTLQKLVGMFAFGVWDKHKKNLYLARDRMGEKPLFYGFVSGVFAFASELGALRRISGFDNEISRNSLALYMRDCNVPAPYSIYKDIFKLQPGSFLVVTAEDVRKKDISEPVAYWAVANIGMERAGSQLLDDRHAIDGLHNLLRNAVQGQMLSDVPLGAFLSGGVDSSLIVSLMQEASTTPVKTFTIGFDDVGYDESPFAASIAKHLGTDHSEFRVSASDALSVIPQIPKMYGEPFADSSQIPTYLVCHAAKQAVTVALSGDAGDELFGGYSRYQWTKNIWSVVGAIPFPLRQAMGSGMRAFPISGWDILGKRSGDRAHKLGAMLRQVASIDELYACFMTAWEPEDNLVIHHKSSPDMVTYKFLSRHEDDPLERMMRRDMVTYLPNDILTKVDRAAMAMSLETRVPMLDHRVVEYALSLPLSMKIRSGETKWILKQILSRYVPQTLLDRPKTGFALPLGSWLCGPLREWAESLLDSRKIDQQGFLNSSLVHQKWQQHLSGKRDWTPQLWAVLMFQSWLADQDRIR